VSSGYIPAKGEPSPDEILQALRREAVSENPRLTEMPAEEVARQLVLGGHLQEEPSPVLVADMLDALEAEGSTFEADELSEEGNSTRVRATRRLALRNHATQQLEEIKAAGEDYQGSYPVSVASLCVPIHCSCGAGRLPCAPGRSLGKRAARLHRSTLADAPGSIARAK
jgi:hypothetical protein